MDKNIEKQIIELCDSFIEKKINKDNFETKLYSVLDKALLERVTFKNIIAYRIIFGLLDKLGLDNELDIIDKQMINDILEMGLKEDSYYVAKNLLINQIVLITSRKYKTIDKQVDLQHLINMVEVCVDNILKFQLSSRDFDKDIMYNYSMPPVVKQKKIIDILNNYKKDGKETIEKDNINKASAKPQQPNNSYVPKQAMQRNNLILSNIEYQLKRYVMRMGYSKKIINDKIIDLVYDIINKYIVEEYFTKNNFNEAIHRIISENCNVIINPVFNFNLDLLDDQIQYNQFLMTFKSLKMSPNLYNDSLELKSYIEILVMSTGLNIKVDDKDLCIMDMIINTYKTERINFKLFYSILMHHCLLIIFKDANVLNYYDEVMMVVYQIYNHIIKMR